MSGLWIRSTNEAPGGGSRAAPGLGPENENDDKDTKFLWSSVCQSELSFSDSQHRVCVCAKTWTELSLFQMWAKELLYFLAWKFRKCLQFLLKTRQKNILNETNQSQARKITNLSTVRLIKSNLAFLVPLTINSSAWESFSHWERGFSPE